MEFSGKLDTFLGLGGRYAKFQARNRELGNVWRIAGTHTCPSMHPLLILPGSAVKASVAANKLAKAEQRREKAVRQREDRKGESFKGKKDGSPSEGFKAQTSPTAETASTSAEPEAAEKQCDEDGEEYPQTSEEEQKANLEVRETLMVFMDVDGFRQGAKHLQETMPLILETMLNVCVVDIEATVRQVAKKVLKDLDTPIEIRRQRAEGLIELGKIFQHEAEVFKKDHKDRKIDVFKHMEDVFIRAAQERDREAHKDESPTPS
ncbi:uncharacterized protein LOC129616945 [Condylostylus longicornis]|uniref:uncharacterized protein LOC129616945 n=1 Tax=Condylostylus longicornis TaxID=2530218 RepID=UPI00244DCF9E|nr:uncharacterized protein LOC129616945 [Condylostylus longicornis]